MIIETRYSHKPPSHDNVERLLIKYGQLTLEIYPTPHGEGIRVALRDPTFEQLVVAPHAGNVLDIHAHRFGK